MNTLKITERQSEYQESNFMDCDQPFQMRTNEEEGGKPKQRASNGSSNLLRYFKDCRKYNNKGILTYEQCCDLAERARNGDFDARNEIVLRNLRLVYKIARRYEWATKESIFSYEDLIQWGNMGLMEASVRFLKDGAPFSYYGGLWIRRTILRELSECISLVRLPVYRYEQGRMVAQALQQEHVGGSMAHNGNDNENITAIADETGLSENTVRLALVLNEGKVVHTLESAIEAGEDIDENAVTPDHILMLREEVEVGCQSLQTWWKFLLSNSLQRDAYIFLRRYKLVEGDWLDPDYKIATLEDVGQEIGKTRERVRQILEDTWRHSRHILDESDCFGFPINGKVIVFERILRRIAAISCSLGISIDPVTIFPLEGYRPPS